MDEPDSNGIESRVEVDLRGISIYTHHGVSDAEQEVGQRLEFDISFDVPDCDAVLTDRIEDTSTTARSATSSPSPPPSAATARSSASPRSSASA